MRIKNHFFWLCLSLVLCVSLPLASCTKNNDATIILIGEEAYVKDILDVIPDTLRVEFMEQFGFLPDGPVPPRIEGKYVVSPVERVSSSYANWLVAVPEPDICLCVTDQHNGVACLDVGEAQVTHFDTVFVIGRGSWFSLWFVEEKNIELVVHDQNCHVSLSQVVVFKGEVVQEGIRDLTFATIILDMDADVDDLELYAPGTFFICKDADGVAERLDW